jgi:hypothetical protein
MCGILSKSCIEIVKKYVLLVLILRMHTLIMIIFSIKMNIVTFYIII